MNKKAATSLDNYTVFRLLCELERGTVSSQRELASRLDSALGLVNSYLKVCTDSGWVRIKENSAGRGSYKITPSGLAERRRLALQHAAYLDEMLSVIYDEYRKVIARLKDQGVARVAICGVEGITGIPYLLLQEAGISVSAAMDTQGTGAVFMGREVTSIAHAMLSGVHRVMITSINRAALLYESLLDMGAEPESIFVPPLFLEPK